MRIDHLILTAALVVALAGGPRVSQSVAQDADASADSQTIAKEALILDGATGAVLFEKNADEPFPPASLAKLMTMEIVFDAVKKGDLSLAAELPVSEHAWRTGGAPSQTSTMFAEVRSAIPVEALIKGTIVQSANDAAIIIAEGMEGTEAGFAARMNRRAGELGMTHSAFVNPTGLPAEGQFVTARDLAILARHIEQTYPDLYRTYSEPEFSWNKIVQRNRNPLLRLEVGATGMGTGFTEAAGYSLVGVADRNGRKTLIVLGGLKSEAERAKEAKRLLEWAEASFQRQSLFGKDQVVGTAAVYGGMKRDVPLVLGEDLVAFVPADKPEAVTAVLSYRGPLQAPVAKGDKIGRMEIRIGDRPSISRDLFAGEDVVQGTFAERALDAAQELAFGWIRLL